MLPTRLGLAAAMASFPCLATAETVGDFYRGKVLRIVVGSAAGGGYDLYARALARELGKHVPGRPTVIVQNQPGAAGMAVVNQLYNAGPFDGTAIGASTNGVPTAPMLQAGAKFDPTKLNWLGSITREAFVAYAWHASSVKEIADLKTMDLTVGATTPGTTMVDYPLLLNDLLGYRFKIIKGYQGPPDVNLAMERGEVQGNGGVGYSTLKSLSQDWLDQKKIRILVQFNMEGVPELKGVPLATDLATSDDERQAMRLLFSRSEFSRPFFLPPDVPGERVSALRNAFDNTVRHPAFVEEAARLQLDVDPMSGGVLQDLVADLAKTPPNVIARVKSALGSSAAK